MSAEFYVVFRRNAGRAPSVAHYKLDEAKAEAERIARKEMEPVYILKAIKVCLPQPPITPEIKWEEI